MFFFLKEARLESRTHLMLTGQQNPSNSKSNAASAKQDAEPTGRSGTLKVLHPPNPCTESHESWLSERTIQRTAMQLKLP